MTGAGNNTYLLAGGGGAILVDAGVGEPRHLEALDAGLAKLGLPLADVIVTHGHIDHASGAPAIAERHPRAQFSKFPWPEQDGRFAVAWRALADGEQISLGGDALTVVRTPGHSPDHLAFWHEATGAVFTGDLVVPGRSVMIHASRGGHLGDYMASLERILLLSPRVLYPAHGGRIDDPAAILTGYLAHRRMRERQVVEALRSGHADVEAIAESIYHALDPALMPAARENVRAHLEKLQSDGRASGHDGRWQLS